MTCQSVMNKQHDNELLGSTIETLSPKWAFSKIGVTFTYPKP